MKYTIEQLCNFAGYSYDVLKQKNRARELVYARYCVVNYLYKSGLSFKESGKYLSLDHSTVCHGIKAINNAFDPMAQNAKRLFEHNMAHFDVQQVSENEQEAFIYESLTT
jgi:chromosomal replication initiation ATPase DnaA